MFYTGSYTEGLFYLKYDRKNTQVTRQINNEGRHDVSADDNSAWIVCALRAGGRRLFNDTVDC
jgi:hypothetical protein